MSTLYSHPGLLKTIARSAVKAASAQFRRIGIGAIYPRWTERAEVCERCPLRVVKCGRSYCGNPLLSQLNRDLARHGCGCPTYAKARDSKEHCPIDSRLQAAAKVSGRCSCKWCSAGLGPEPTGSDQ